MKVLVTGAHGMLARSAIAVLEGAGHEVLGLSRVDADVTQLEALRHPVDVFRPDWVLHCAAWTRVDECERDPDRAFLVNGLGAGNAAQAAAAAGAAVVSISTDYVFAGDVARPYREYDLAAPRSVYGASKWAGEERVRELNPRHLIVRTAWLYGHGGPNFIDTILRKAQDGEPLKVVDDQRGSPTWTRDLAEGLMKLMAAGAHGTYHCTNAGDCTWYDLAAYALERAGVHASLDRTRSAKLGRPAPRPAYSVLDNHWFEHVTGSRLPPWQDAVNRYLAPGGPTS